jgi:hypothetical protein
MTNTTLVSWQKTRIGIRQLENVSDAARYASEELRNEIGPTAGKLKACGLMLFGWSQ